MGDLVGMHLDGPWFHHEASWGRICTYCSITGRKGSEGAGGRRKNIAGITGSSNSGVGWVGTSRASECSRRCWHYQDNRRGVPEIKSTGNSRFGILDTRSHTLGYDKRESRLCRNFFHILHFEQVVHGSLEESLTLAIKLSA